MKKILKYAGLSISIIMLAVSVVFIVLLINVRVVPVKYCIIAAAVLVILTAVTAFTQKWFVPGIISNYTSVLSEVSKNVITDMSYDFIAELAQTQLNDMAAWNITQISVTGAGSYSSTTYSMPGWSLYIMVPDEESVENAREQIRDNYN